MKGTLLSHFMVFQIITKKTFIFCKVLKVIFMGFSDFMDFTTSIFQMISLGFYRMLD